MKIGIDARFLTHPQQGGFKTYTENLVQGLAKLDTDNEYVLYTDRPGAEDRYSRANFKVVPIGGQAILREQVNLPIAMACERVDIAHFLCNTAPILLPCSLILTVHDLIPCLGKSVHIETISGGAKGRIMWNYWRSVIPKAARRASRVVTISESSKADIINTLGVKEEKINVIPTGLHPDFCPSQDSEEMYMVRETYNLPASFILGFASSDPRKNTRRLLDAVHMASDRLGDTGLVLVCASDAVKAMVKEMISDWTAPLASRVRLLVGVPRKDLVVVYSLADILAFPSLYEGFGLPVVEAMACGTPVITSNVSSLPEIVGESAVLVDPTDTSVISDALARVINDNALWRELRTMGIERSAMYGWEHTVHATISAYEATFSAGRAKSGLSGHSCQA